MRNRRTLSTFTALILASSSLALPAAAQIVSVPSGFVADGAHGPFLSGITYKLLGQVVVSTNATLTIEPGAVIKAPAGFVHSILVDGTLDVQGTELNPVVFTCYPDDSAGADLDGGLSVGLPGQWGGIHFRDGSEGSTVDFARIRFAGAQGLLPAVVTSTDITLRDTHVTDTNHDGVLITSGAQPALERCQLDRNSRPIADARYDNLRHFVDNTAEGNQLGNYVDIATDVENRFFEDADLGPENLLNSVIVTANGMVVPPGISVTLRPGVVVKLSANKNVTHQGTLRCLGTALAPVVFTSLHDDKHAGDTNLNGAATSPVPGEWRGFSIGAVPDYVLELEHTLVRYGGDGVIVNGASSPGASITVANSVVEHASGDAVDAAGSNNEFRVTDSILRDNGGIALRNVAFEMVGDFNGNTAEGNTEGDYLQLAVGSTSILGSVSIGPDNYPGDAAVLGGGFLLAAGETLTIEAGVVLKMANGGTVTIDRNANVHFDGTAQHPIVLTALTDDSVGGDTNKDGAATLPQAGEGVGVSFATGIGTADKVMTHTRLRYGPQTGLAVLNNEALVSAVRIDSPAGVGVVLTKHEGPLRNVQVHGAGGDGIQLQGSGLDLRNVTVSASGGHGIRRVAGTPSIASSISWNNALSNYDGIDSSTVSFSLGGFDGVNGNVDLDPEFLDAAGGDLRLAPTSPCVDGGDPLDAPLGQDLDGNPRVLDGDLNGAARLDMGATEFTHARLELSGDTTPGGTFFLHSTGTPGLPALIFAGPQAGSLPLSPYGELFIDITGGLVFQSWPAAPASVPLTSAAPLTLVAQTLVVGGAGAHLSNPVTIEVE